MRDGLTGLWNRTAFLDLFQHELERARRSDAHTGLLLLDLDNFKHVNDTYGHLTGDLVLKEAANRLRQHVRSYDFVGRYGGEEFFIALPGSDREQLCRRAEAIRKSIWSEPIRVPQGNVSISLSIGAAVADAGETSATDLLGLADMGLYKAKDSGRNRSVFCEKRVTEMFRSPATHRDICSQCDPNQKAACVLTGS
jgi:diguanylate cyclase (GGDEF)-like protein